MYGLRSSPKDWQTHWATVLATLCFLRLQSDANVYVHLALQIYILVYVDDLMIIGRRENIEQILKSLKEYFLIKDTGELNSEGCSVTLLGRILKRVGDSVLLIMKSGYIDAEFEEFGLTNCKGSSTPGSKGVKRPPLMEPTF